MICLIIIILLGGVEGGRLKRDEVGRGRSCQIYLFYFCLFLFYLYYDSFIYFFMFFSFLSIYP